MAQISIIVPDTNAQEVADGFIAKYAGTPDAKLPSETKLEYVKRCLAMYVKSVYIDYKASSAAATARDAAKIDANAVVIS